MRRFFKIFLVLLILTGACATGLLVLNQTVLPTRFKAWAETTASEALGRPVSIGQVRIHPWHGFLLEQVRLQEDARFGDQPFLQIERISGGLLFLPFLKERQLVIPTLRIVQARGQLLQNSQGDWNVQSLLLKKKEERVEGKKPLQLLIPKIILIDGQLKVHSAVDPPLELELQRLNALVHLSLPNRIEGSLEATVHSGKSQPLQLEGFYDFQERTFEIQCNAALDLSMLGPYLSRFFKTPALSLEGSTTLDLKISGKPEGPFGVKGSIETQSFQGSFPQPFRSGWQGQAPQSLKVQGDLAADLDGIFPSLKPKDPLQDLMMNVVIDGMQFEPLPHLQSLHGVTGNIQVDSRGVRTENLRATLPSGTPLELSGSIENDRRKTIHCFLKGTLPFAELYAMLPQNNPFPADKKPVGLVHFNLTGKGFLQPTVSFRPTGTLTLEEVVLPLPEFKLFSGLKELRHFSGDIQVTPDGIQTQNLTAHLLSSAHLNIQGSIANNPQRTAILKFQTTLPVAEIPTVVPHLSFFQHLKQMSGQAIIDGIGSGNLSSPSTFESIVTTQLKGFSATLPNGTRIERAGGMIRWQPDLVTITGMQGLLMESPFELEGTLVNFKQPEVDADLSWGELSTKMQLTITPESIDLNLLTGRFGTGTFRVLGEITRVAPPATSGNAPLILNGNLFAEGTFHLEELSQYLPQSPDWFKQLNPRGRLSARGTLKGNLVNLKEWEFNLKGSSPILILQGIPLDQVTLDLQQRKGRISLRAGHAKLAGGSLSVAASLNQNKPEQPWRGVLKAEEVDLVTLAKQFNWKIQNLSGTLSLDWEGGGKALNPKDLYGTGKLHVGGGQILELPFLGPFATVLNLPTLEKMTFREAEGPFALANGRLMTKNLQVTSPQATLAIMGSGGFLQGLDSSIDWKIIPVLSPKIVPREARSKLGRAIAKGTTLLTGEILIDGTWRNPKRTVIPRPLTQILKKELFNLPDLLEDLFRPRAGNASDPSARP